MHARQRAFPPITPRAHAPLPALHLDPRAHRHQKAAHPLRAPRRPRRPRKAQHMRRLVHARLPHLAPVDAPPHHPAALLAHPPRLQERRVAAVRGLRQPKRRADLARQQAVHERAPPRRVRLEAADHDADGEVADDRVLRLQVVGEAEALRGEVLADDAHPEVSAAALAGVGLLAAVGAREGEAVEAGGVGGGAGGAQQGGPVRAGEAVVGPVGAGGFAAVVEEAGVVVAELEGRDGGGDEGVEAGEVGLEVGGEIRVGHGGGHGGGVRAVGWGSSGDGQDGSCIVRCEHWMIIGGACIAGAKPRL